MRADRDPKNLCSAGGNGEPELQASRRRPNRAPSRAAPQSWDRLRLDVGIADGHEVYSWVGATRFEDADVHKLIGGGQTNSGDFASALYSIFFEHPSMRFVGEKQIDSRRLFEYTYNTPLEISHYEISFGVGRFTIAYHGSVFLDPESGEVARVTSASEELQQSIGYCQVNRTTGLQPRAHRLR